MTADESGARGAQDARGLVERDYDLVRLGPPARGDTIHRSTCRYAQKSNALLWAWADKHEHEDWAVTAPWLRACRTCKPPSPAGRRTNVCMTNA